jgi:hypothetical protein
MTASTALGGRQPRSFAPPTLSERWIDAARRAVAFAAVSLAMAVMIAAIMAVSLGLGYERYSSAGPDRPALPAAPAPAPAPAPLPIRP